MSTWSGEGEINYYTTLSATYMKHTGIMTYKEQEKTWATPTRYCKHQKLLQASEILLDFHNLSMKDVYTSQQSFASPGEQGPAASIPLLASFVPSNQDHNVTYLTNPQGAVGCC